MKTELQQIPGVGPNMERHFHALGYTTLDSLKGADPEEMYLRDRALHGGKVDRCVLYVYRLAVAWAEGRELAPEQRNWWGWKD